MASALLESLLAERGALPAPRAAAADALLRDGLPGARDEAWKYTSLRALEQRRYAAGDADAATRAVDPAAFALPGIDAPRLVFVNGAFRADLSDLRAIPGVTLDVLGARPDLLAALPVENDAATNGAAARENAFLRLNTALAADGAWLRVDAGAKVETPLHLVFAGAAAAAELAWQLRLRIELGEGSALRVVEHYVGAGDNAHLGNVVADHVLAPSARLDLVQIQDAAAASLLIRRSRCRLEREAALFLHTVEVGAQTMRHDLRVELAGAGARLVSRGVFALRGRQHADTHLDVRHDARDTASDILWRGVADERARGVFHGAITVAKGADGADAQLGNKNLLLSAQAEIDTQPVLEIHADEVKAAHGATVGQLDEQVLFYLRSRGLPRDTARRILVSAFCGAMLADLEPRALRERLDTLLATRLPSEAANT
jgi:Fe-S cluster assembly protein SufD